MIRQNEIGLLHIEEKCDCKKKKKKMKKERKKERKENYPKKKKFGKKRS